MDSAVEFARSSEFEDSEFAVKFMLHWINVLTIKDPRGLRYDPEIFQLSSSLLHQLGVNKYAELRFSTSLLFIHFCARHKTLTICGFYSCFVTFFLLGQFFKC